MRVSTDATRVRTLLAVLAASAEDCRTVMVRNLGPALHGDRAVTGRVAWQRWPLVVGLTSIACAAAGLRLGVGLNVSEARRAGSTGRSLTPRPGERSWWSVCPPLSEPSDAREATSARVAARAARSPSSSVSAPSPRSCRARRRRREGERGSPSGAPDRGAGLGRAAAASRRSRRSCRRAGRGVAIRPLARPKLGQPLLRAGPRDVRAGGRPPRVDGGLRIHEPVVDAPSTDSSRSARRPRPRITLVHRWRLQRSIVTCSYSRNTRGASWAAHASYLARGARRDGAKGLGFDAVRDDVDLTATCRGWQRAGDVRLWKFVVSPEHGARLDLRAHTRALVEQLERDLGTRVEWAAVEHHNTDHPHVHLVVRGRAEERPLEIAFSYLSGGLAARSRELATLVLGFRSGREHLAARDHEVERERFTGSIASCSGGPTSAAG